MKSFSENENQQPPNKKSSTDANNVYNRRFFGTNLKFFFSTLGLSVGFGNMWSFPYLAHKYGGATFIFAYLVLLIFIGFPFMFMEMSIGQFSTLGPIKVWSCFPAGKGVGIAMLILTSYILFYYGTLLSYSLLYFYYSFWTPLPWSDCYEWWGADNNCQPHKQLKEVCHSNLTSLMERYCPTILAIENNETDLWRDLTIGNKSCMVPKVEYEFTVRKFCSYDNNSLEQFFHKFIIESSDCIINMGEIKTDLALCLAITWLFIFRALIQNYDSPGKVAYFTKSLHYIVLILMTTINCINAGAIDGIRLLLIPNWHNLLELEVWNVALIQMMFSFGTTSGLMIMNGSFFKMNTSVLHHSFWIVILNFVSSLLCCILNFTNMGVKAHDLGVPIEYVFSVKDFEIFFVTYPFVVVQLWIPEFWSALFFFMVFSCAIDCAIGGVDLLFFSILDSVPITRRHKISLIIILCLFFYVISLITVAKGGFHIVTLMNSSIVGITILGIGLFEVSFLMWGYGGDKWKFDAQFLLQRKISNFYKYMLSIPAPILFFVCFIYSIICFVIKNEKRVLLYKIMSTILIILSVTPPIVYVLYAIHKNRKDIKKCFLPTKTWGPLEETDRIQWLEMKLKMK